jgi:hypothetical protein
MVRTGAVVGTAAILIATCAAPSFARHHNSNSASEVTTTVSPNGSVQTTVTTASVGIDYSVLADPDLNYFDIRRAQAYGLTDNQIAQAAKLAHYGYVPMGDVLNQLEDGCTLASLAVYYGVPINVVEDASGWQDRINDYLAAYRNTGRGALRNGPTQTTVTSYSSNTGQINMKPVTSSTSSTYNSTTQFNSTTTTPMPGTMSNGGLNNGTSNNTGTLNNGTMGNSVAPGTTLAPGTNANGTMNNGTEPSTTTPGTTGTDTGTMNNTTNAPGTTGAGATGTGGTATP